MTARRRQQSPLLTRRQLRRLETLPDDYKVVSASDGTPIVESPTGQTLRIQPNGRLAATGLLDTLHSHVHVRRS